MAKWALLSVFDKQGIVAFAERLTTAGYGILSTGGTLRHLRESGVAATAVEDHTGFPEMMDGRVKTLHPRIHGGILALRDDVGHVASLQQHNIDTIDIVAVNLYPFAQTIAKPNTTFAEAVEMIDIGGPSMLRAAAKNHRFSLPVVDPTDYDWLATRLAAGEDITAAERQRLAQKTFATCAEYDACIADYLVYAAVAADSEPKTEAGTGTNTSGTNQATATATSWPETYALTYVHKQSLRYGENPHQTAHFYQEQNASPATIAGAVQLQGKELSYNNIQDADAALSILRSLDDLNTAAAVAVKHTNPCGVGIGTTIEEAYLRAYEADPVSIFGGILAFNRPLTASVAERLTGMFLEIVIAPSFTPEALMLFQKKKNVRLLTVAMNDSVWHPGDKTYRRVSGGLLVQDVNLPQGDADWRVVTDRSPTEAEWRALRFGWRIVQYVKSNAILLTNEHSTVGVGAGQMNRVGAAKIAIEQAGARAKGSSLASDAFFPMRDTVDTAAAAGITAIIQPGGSIKDAESIAAANEHDIAMVFTAIRHFMH